MGPSIKNNSCFVIDTSSIIQIKQSVPQAHRTTIFQKLAEYVKNELLVYPKEVLDELEKGTVDQPYLWAKHNAGIATRYGALFDELKLVMSDPIANKVLDPTKVGIVEADPHVLALALHLRNSGVEPIVINDETRNKPNKLSLTQACGALRLVSLTVEVFLDQENIWRR